MTEPLPAETSGPRSDQIVWAAAAASSPASTRRSTRPTSVPTSGGSERNHSRWRSTRSAGSNPPCAESDRTRFRAIAVSSVVEPGGRPSHGRSNAGSGFGTLRERRNSNGAPRASPSASPRTLPATRSAVSIGSPSLPEPPPQARPPARTPLAGTLAGRNEQGWTSSSHVSSGRDGPMWSSQLPGAQACLSARPARARPQALLRIPGPTAGEAEAAPHLRGRRAPDARLLRPRQPQDRRHRRGAPPPARDPPGRRDPPARVRPDPAAGPPAGQPRPRQGERPPGRCPERSGPPGGHRRALGQGQELRLRARGDRALARSAAVPVPQHGPAPGHDVASPRARRDPAPGSHRGAADHRVLLLAAHSPANSTHLAPPSPTRYASPVCVTTSSTLSQ